MRGTTLMLTASAALILSGCSQISGLFKGNSHGATDQTEATLRSTPVQSYEFSDPNYDVELYDTTTSSTVQTYSDGYGHSSASSYSYSDYSAYTGYDVVLYSTPSTQFVNYTPVDPREAAFVKLNGKSEAMDWRNCETMSRGYMYISEYDFSLDPDFEVCMRNKGYVLTGEAGSLAADVPVSARTAGLRGYSQPTHYGQSSGTYQYPTSSNYSYP